MAAGAVLGGIVAISTRCSTKPSVDGCERSHEQCHRDHPLLLQRPQWHLWSGLKAHMIDLKEGTPCFHIGLNRASHTLLHQRDCQRKGDEPAPCTGAAPSWRLIYEVCMAICQTRS